MKDDPTQLPRTDSQSTAVAGLNRQRLRMRSPEKKVWNVVLAVEVSAQSPQVAAEIGLDILARRLAEGGTITVANAKDEIVEAFQFSFSFGVRQSTVLETEESRKK